MYSDNANNGVCDAVESQAVTAKDNFNSYDSFSWCQPCTMSVCHGNVLMCPLIGFQIGK